MGDILFWVIGFPFLIFCIFVSPLLLAATGEMTGEEAVWCALGLNLFGGFIVGLSGGRLSPLIWMFWIPALLSEKVRDTITR